MLRTSPRTHWLLAAMAVLLLQSSIAEAHLSIIRQGRESHGFRESGDRFGAALAYGDFNGDGYEDLAVGSPDEDSQNHTETGAVTINYGSEHGLTHVAAALILPGIFGVPLNDGSRLGHALAAADLNGDGYSDLLIGVPGEIVGGVTNAGRVYGFYGGPTGLTAWFGFGQENIGGTSVTNEYFGASLAIDDFNNDGYPDIAMGASGRGVTAGSVFVSYGVNTGPFGTVTETSAEDLGLDYQNSDQFAFSLATGNIIGDSNPDLIVGSPGRHATTSYLNAGAVHIIPGTPAGIDHNQGITRYNNLAGALSGRAAFGHAVAVAPVPGYDILIVGEPKRTIGSAEWAGRIVIATGQAGGPPAGSGYALTQSDFGDTPEHHDEFGFSLATGRFLNDTWHDLAIGAPGEDFPNNSSGVVHVSLGGPSGFGGHGWYGYNQGIIGDFNETGDRFAEAVSLGGEFDDAEEGTLVVGSPGEDANAGSVHVLAPWRQSYFHTHKTACAMNCTGELVFTQKPFDQVFIASTTKIMTVLLACERTQLPTNHPDYVSLDATYTVPDWVETDIGGSTANLIEDERLTLRDLIYLTLHISANDGAHAIGDMLHGAQGPWKSIPSFIAAMNTRAIELGMYDTRFNNANGFEQEAVGYDLGDHYSTAYDMAILTRAALQNELFREIATTPTCTAQRWQPDGLLMHQFDSFQKWILDNPNINGLGVKGGWTPAAGTTFCMAAAGPFGNAVFTAFDLLTNSPWGTELNNYINIALNACGGFQQYEPWYYEYLSVREAIRPQLGRAYRFSAHPSDLSAVQFDLFQANLDVAPLDATVTVSRSSELELDQNDSVPFEIVPFESHGEMLVTNRSDRVTKIRIVTPFFNRFVDLGPNGTTIIPAADGAMDSFQWTIENFDGDSDPLMLEVKEVYHYDVDAPAIVTSDPLFQAAVERDPRTMHDVVELNIDWHAEGGEYVLVSHEPGITVDAPEGGPRTDEPGASPLVSWSAAPNPFQDQSVLRFQLDAPSAVGISIYDAGGRLVRKYATETRDAGEWSLAWDGRNQFGERTPPGVYFYQVRTEGRTATAKVTRVQ